MLSLPRKQTGTLEYVACVLHVEASVLLRPGQGIGDVAVRAHALALNSADGLGTELPFK
jgi:hypothetical protein